uniref:Aminotransferase-like plant mobile domain-containing protein n=1 Tax=Fagus sylvatica TaxID=28930 RepID=A0A2N9GTA7_FAGSY
MASSSKKKMKGRGGSSSGKGGSPGGARVPRGSGDDSSGSDSILGSPEPHGDILGRPTVDPWYRSGERFPSVPASLQPPPPDWEWLQAGVLRSILISRCSNMFRDTEALRQLVRRWCPSTHTFFFAHGEMTVTLEDIENQWLLPILGDQDPAEIALSPEESKVEAVLAELHRAKKRVRFPLAPLLLGQLYTQLDLLHAEELAGASCHIVTAAFNSSIVHTFIWEHALEYIRKGRKPYEARKKFGSMPEGVVVNVGDFQGDVPAVFRWVGSKFYDHSLIPSLDSESKVCWRPYGVSHRGFMYESVMSGFSNIEAQDYSLIAGDTASLAYLSATNAGWLPVLTSDGLRFTVYSAHRVRRQFGFDQEVPAVMGVAAGEIPVINPFLRTMAFAYWSGVAPRVIIPSGDRVGIYTTAMSNYWGGLMAAMVEFRDSGRRDISHLLESYTSPLPHPLPHPPLWLRDHPHVAAPGKVPSSRGRRTASASTPTVKRKQPDRSKKGEATSKDSPVQASKRIKTTTGRVSKEVLALKTAVPDPLPTDETACSRGFCPTSIAARVAARKSGRGIVYSEKRSKQRADTAARIPIEIPDDLSSSSSSSNKDDPSGAAAEETESGNAEVAAAEETESENTEVAAAEETESESTEAAAAEAVSGADDFTADISSADIGSLDTDAIINASSEEKDVEAGASTKDNEVSMDELGAAGAASDSDSTASASKPKSAEGVVEEHVTVGVVTGAERVVETTPIAVTSSGGTVQGDISESGSHVDPSLLDSSPSTLTARVPTPPSPLRESGGTAPTPIIITAAVSAATAVQKGETAPAVTEEVPGHEEVPAHIPEVPEGNILAESILIDENLVTNGDFNSDMAHVEPAEVAASEEPVQADVTPSSGIPVIEEELAQDPVDDIDMGDTHDSYDEVLAETEDNMAGDQAADMEVTAPVAAQTSPTRTARSGRETVAEEEGRLQAAAVESAVRGQPGLLSAARPATSRTSVLADMDAFFREFDRTSFSSRHAEHFWTFDDVKADFEVFRVPPRRNSVLEGPVGKHTRLGDITEVHILEWKAVVQEAIEGGFKFGFILDYLRRLARDIFSRRVLAELREAEARVAALRDALNAVAPSPWDLASARRASAEARTESALQGLLS